MKLHTAMICSSAVWLTLRFSEDDEYTYIQPAEATTIFQPFGEIINQYTYANIRVHINVTSLLDEINQLYYVSKL